MKRESEIRQKIYELKRQNEKFAESISNMSTEDAFRRAYVKQYNENIALIKILEWALS